MSQIFSSSSAGLRAEAANFSQVDIKEWHTDLSCRSINSSSSNYDWRNILTKEYLSSLNSSTSSSSRIEYFELNNTMRDLADLHISHPYSIDCTHYCYAPLLWQPLWHRLADMAEKMV